MIGMFEVELRGRDGKQSHGTPSASDREVNNTLTLLFQFTNKVINGLVCPNRANIVQDIFEWNIIQPQDSRIKTASDGTPINVITVINKLFSQAS